jgi:hypothetical protein
MATVYEFNPVSGQYLALAPLPQTRVHFALVAHPNGFLYAIGGSNKYSWGSSLYPLSGSFMWLSNVPRYSVAFNRWIP